MGKGNAQEAEIVISKALKIGVLLSAAVIFTGFLMYLITGDSGYPGSTFPTSLSLIFQGVVSLKSYAIILLGLLILILTPVFRVGVSIIVFIKEKDYRFAKITALVFAILIVSFLIGKVE